MHWRQHSKMTAKGVTHLFCVHWNIKSVRSSILTFKSQEGLLWLPRSVLADGRSWDSLKVEGEDRLLGHWGRGGFIPCEWLQGTPSDSDALYQPEGMLVDISTCLGGHGGRPRSPPGQTVCTEESRLTCTEDAVIKVKERRGIKGRTGEEGRAIFFVWGKSKDYPGERHIESSVMGTDKISFHTGALVHCAYQSDAVLIPPNDFWLKFC